MRPRQLLCKRGHSLDTAHITLTSRGIKRTCRKCKLIRHKSYYTKSISIKIKGIRWRSDREKWQAYYVKNKKFKSLGFFDTIKRATMARIEYQKLSGESLTSFQKGHRDD